MTDEMAAARAVVKLGSAAIAAVTVSITDCCCVSSPTGIVVAGGALCGRYIASGDGTGNGIAGAPTAVGWTPPSGRWRRPPPAPGGACVRSRVMVGNGVEAESVAMVDA
jgi:hypothetical protein